LEGGEALEIGGRTLDVAYTPGHATHHVSYLDHTAGTAFVGDMGGMRVPGTSFVLPVTPPPDVELEDWHASLHLLRDWDPEQLFITHFGAWDDVTWHLDEIARHLDEWSEQVRLTVAEDGDEGDDGAQAKAFRDQEMAVIEAKLDPSLQAPYGIMGLIEPSWHGLARYWRKRL
jgi:glyoxylase-like metal-dependent hydrolase (beta-lactamase superfamily II)